MKTRILTGFVLSVIIIPIVYYSNYWVYPIFISILCAIAMFEMQKCIGTIKKWPISIPSFLLSIAGPIVARLISVRGVYTPELICSIIILFVYNLLLFVFSFEKYHFEDICASMITSIYIVASFSSLVLLRDVDFGSYYVVFAFAAPWVSDIFAYFTGKLFGKHKLIEKVSPKKTIEGSIGAIVFTAVFCLVYGLVVSTWYNPSLKPNYVGLIIVGVILSVAGQMGDLIASAIKRRYGIKDYGNLLPGHGGVLDRFDSVMLTGLLVLIFTLFSDSIAIFQV